MDPYAPLLGDSPGIVALRDQVRGLLLRHSHAGRFPPILLQGETGTGKGLVAHIIHRAGPRRDRPFVNVNCAAIPDTLLEAEMFGYERGAFTDARQAKSGLFQSADHGTIFLDEVALMPAGLQAKFLTVIEERAVRRLGSTRDEPIDVWLITASNEDLAAAIQDGRFREDLYHRIAVLTLSLPPLRDRGADVIVLAETFLTHLCADYGLSDKTLTEDARHALLAYRWPGNVRELANVMERVALLSDGPLVTAATLGLPVGPAPQRRELSREPEPLLDHAVRGHLLSVLGETNWNISRAATKLGIARNTLRARIAKYGLRPETASQPWPPPSRPPAASPSSAPQGEIAVPVGLRWERRRLALLRAELAQPREDDAMRTNAYFDAVVDKVRSFGGRVEELSSIGITASFGVEPLEDGPRRALLSALAIHKTAETPRQGAGEPFAVKVGIHVGQCMVGRIGGHAALHQDSKSQLWSVLESLVEAAEPGRILVSSSAAPFLDARAGVLRTDRAAAQPYRVASEDR